MSAKYPRTFHLPWSPGGTNDDKRCPDVDALIGHEIVVTEKCDGSNLTYTRQHVFSRSHSGPPAHPSFALAKATHARICGLIDENLSIFCEYCFAVHSIEYNALPDYSLVFGVRDDEKSQWWSWDMVELAASSLGLPTVPVLFRGVVPTAKALEELTNRLAAQPSRFGTTREGVVVRRTDAFEDAQFSRMVAKWVRHDHIQTDEHWSHQAIRRQTLVDAT